MTELTEETKVLLYTLSHIRRVEAELTLLAGRLIERAANHDTSKFSEDEFVGFFKINKIAREFGYGSPEYRQSIEDGKPTFDLHYGRNSHHPEHWPDGVNDMGLFDIIEMVIDWHVAWETYRRGPWSESVELQIKRFDLTPEQLYLVNLIAAELE